MCIPRSGLKSPRTAEIHHTRLRLCTGAQIPFCRWGFYTKKKRGIPHYSSHIWLWPSGKIMDSLRILMMASSYPILLQLCCGLPTLVKLPLLLSFGICKWLSSRLRSRLVHCVVACLVRGGKAEQWMLKPLGVWMFSQPQPERSGKHIYPLVMTNIAMENHNFS